MTFRCRRLRRTSGWRALAFRQRRYLCSWRLWAVWLGWLEPAMTNVRSGPNWASIGLAQDALVGVRHNSTLFRATHARIFAVLFAERLSRIT